MDSQKLDLVTEYEFEAGADAPMSMAYSDNVRVSIHWPWVPYPNKLLSFYVFPWHHITPISATPSFVA